MIRNLFLLALCITYIFVTACSQQGRSREDAEEWADVQALAADEDALSTSLDKEVALESEFDRFVLQLKQMKDTVREPKQVLLTGERLVLDHGRRLILLEQDVSVEDDRGVLKSDSLTARFSDSNTVEHIVALGHVQLESDGRTASAEQGQYDCQTGFIELMGHAIARDGETRLSGERIQVWSQGSRKIRCEPNALLEITSGMGLTLNESNGVAFGNTEIRADQIVFDVEKGTVVFSGNARLRDPRVAMNCETVKIFLKDNDEIDWIEATGEVIIQSEGRKAIADRMSYLASEGKFVLEGEPKVKQGQNIMTGERIVFWQETQQVVCEPNARVILHPDEETRAKFLKELDR